MTLDHIHIRLPFPDSALMPNRKHGQHWGKTQAAKIRAKQDGYLAAKQALGRNEFPAGHRMPIRITFAMPDRRHRDMDNLLSACKASLDGIAKALGIDDKAFRPITLVDAIDVDNVGFVLVEITAAETIKEAA